MATEMFLAISDMIDLDNHRTTAKVKSGYSGLVLSQHYVELGRPFGVTVDTETDPWDHEAPAPALLVGITNVSDPEKLKSRNNKSLEVGEHVFYINTFNGKKFINFQSQGESETWKKYFEFTHIMAVGEVVVMEVKEDHSLSICIDGVWIHKVFESLPGDDMRFYVNIQGIPTISTIRFPMPSTQHSHVNIEIDLDEVKDLFNPRCPSPECTTTKDETKQFMVPVRDVMGELKKSFPPPYGYELADVVEYIARYPDQSPKISLSALLYGVFRDSIENGRDGYTIYKKHSDVRSAVITVCLEQIRKPSFCKKHKPKTGGWRPSLATAPANKLGRESGPSSSKRSCSYHELCQRYLQSIGISTEYLDARYDHCYCEDCMDKGDEQLYYFRGNPPALYAIPVGWARAGLLLGPQAAKLDIFGQWHVAYHGTSADNIERILDSRDLLMPGDIAMDGKELKPPVGHFTEDRKPKGFDIKQVFVSPTIRYAGLRTYAKMKVWKDAKTGKSYNTRVVLQLRIKPGSYTVGTETVLPRNMRELQVDPRFSNRSLEWSTKMRGATIPVGIMIRLDNVNSGF